MSCTDGLPRETENHVGWRVEPSSLRKLRLAASTTTEGRDQRREDLAGGTTDVGRACHDHQRGCCCRYEDDDVAGPRSHGCGQTLQRAGIAVDRLQNEMDGGVRQPHRLRRGRQLVRTISRELRLEALRQHASGPSSQPGCVRSQPAALPAEPTAIGAGRHDVAKRAEPAEARGRRRGTRAAVRP